MMDKADAIRIDKWLWCTRLYKTRSQATDACRAGKVRMQDHPVKPSHEVRPGSVIALSFPPMVRTIRVLLVTEKRLSAKLVPDYLEELTPPEELGKLKRAHDHDFEFRPRGLGRPTKRERREIELLKKMLDR